MSVKRARALRKALTPQEVKLWVHLRSWRPLGHHFRRQVPKDGYILDFVCLRSRLIVEADGGQHGFEKNIRSDAVRDAHFRQHGFEILRFWNNDIDENLEGVLETIFSKIEGSDPIPAFRADPSLMVEG
jgi:very-short-patch-repair endonuclease